MRIIKQTMKLPEKNIDCKYCKSELAYNDKDICITYYEWSHEQYIICPVCNRKIVLKTISEGC